MTKKKNQSISETPIAVRVARWSAIAAAVTVIGSVFSTVWVERPWWAQQNEAAPITRTVELTPPNILFKNVVRSPEASPRFSPESVNEAREMLKTARPNSGEKTDTEMQSMMATSAQSPQSTGFIKDLWLRLEYRPYTIWPVLGGLLIGGIYLVIEFFHRKDKKKQP